MTATIDEASVRQTRGHIANDNVSVAQSQVNATRYVVGRKFTKN